MKYLSKTNQELLEEISTLKQRIKELEHSESKLSQSEKALLQSEERFKSLVDNINFGINLINKDFQIITSNIVSGKQFNKPVSKIIGKHCFKEFEKRQTVCEHCPGVLAMANGQSHQVDTEGIRDDGSRFLARIHAFPLYDPDGAVWGFNEVVEDITEQKQTENKLRDQEEKYIALFNNAQVALFMTRACDGKVLAINKRYAEKAGYSSIEECLEDFNAAEAWVDQNKRKAMLKILQEKGSVQDFEAEIICKDETRKWISFSATLFSEQGIIEGSVVDITARKHAEAVIEDNDKKFAATFYKSPIPMVITSIKDGRYIDVNESFMQVMGYKYEELIGNSSTNIGYITSESRALFLQEYNQNGFVENLELEIRVKDGKLRRGLFNSSKITINNEDFFLTMVTDITELRQIEEELRQSEAMLSIVFKAAPIGICVLKDHVFINANDEWLKNSGYSKNEIIGSEIKLLYESEEEYEYVNQEVRESLLKKGYASIQTTQRRKDGSIRDVILTIVPLQAKDIFSEVFVVTAQDITERRRAEQELVRKTALLEAQVEATIDGILIVDGKGQKILANQQLLKIWEFPEHIREDKDNASFLQYVTGVTKFPKLFLEKVSYFNENPDKTSRDEIEFKNGMVLDCYSSPVLDKNKKYYGRIWTFRDITARKLAEDALKASEEKYRNIFEGATEGIFQSTPDGKYLSVNPAFAGMFGYPSSQDMTNAVSNIGEQHYVNPEHREKMVQILSEKGSIAGYEIEVYRKDMSKFWISVNIHTVCDDMGNILYFEGTNIDITARKQAEQELAWKTALLEAQVEATIDGILIVDGNGQKILANQRILNILNVPQHIRDDEDGASLLRYITSTTKYPENFLTKVLYLHNHQDETSQDEIEFKNGMVLDRYSSPVLGKDGKYYGRIWTFRDITNRKREEEEKLRLEKLQGVLEMAGAICHEMNQPMQIISGISELLLINICENDPIKEKIKIINEQIGRMAIITKKLMSINDYETQDYAGVSRIVDINKSSGKLMQD